MHIDFSELENYIDKKISNDKAFIIEEHLKKCSECFKNYIELKEVRFYISKGHKASVDEENGILDIVTENKIPFARIIIRFVQNQVFISSGGQENLDFQAMKYDFVTRGTNRGGVVSVSRVLDDYVINLILTPEQEGFSLTLELEPDDSLRAKLHVNNEEIETILNTKNQKLFDSILPKNGEIRLNFSNKQKELFYLEISLESE